MEIKTKSDLDKIISENFGKLIIVRFHASWCSPCRALANTINSLTLEESNGVEFVEVDVDEVDEDLVDAYSIKSIPVLVFFKDGLVADKAVGLVTKQQLLNKIEEVKNK